MSLITFTVNDDAAGQKNSVSCKDDIDAEKFMLDYVTKYTDYVTLDTKIYIFKVGIKIINSNKYLKTKLRDLLQNGSLVNFIRKQGLHYS